MCERSVYCSYSRMWGIIGIIGGVENTPYLIIVEMLEIRLSPSSRWTPGGSGQRAQSAREILNKLIIKLLNYFTIFFSLFSFFLFFFYPTGKTCWDVRYWIFICFTYLTWKSLDTYTLKVLLYVLNVVYPCTHVLKSWVIWTENIMVFSLRGIPELPQRVTLKAYKRTVTFSF